MNDGLFSGIYCYLLGYNKSIKINPIDNLIFLEIAFEIFGVARKKTNWHNAFFVRKSNLTAEIRFPQNENRAVSLT